MAWPANVSTVGTESDSDELTDARPSVNATIDAVNEIIDARESNDGIPSLDSTGKVTKEQLRQINNPVVKTSGYTTVASDNGRIIICEGPIVITVDSDISFVGTWHVIKNGNQGATDDTVTVTVSGGSDIEGNDTIFLRPGDGITIVRGSNRWYALGSFRQAEITSTNFTSRQFSYFDTKVFDPSSTWNDVTSSLTEATWESVGPTGSGADYIWDALDNVPRVDGFLLLNANGIMSPTVAGFIEMSLYVREFGSSTAIGDYNYVYNLKAYNDNSDFNRSVSQRVVPVDNNGRFELYWTEDTNNATGSIGLTLSGFWV